MTVAIWPSDLPRPLREGYASTRSDTRRRRLAGGPLGYTRRFSSAPRIVNLSIEVSRAKKAIFDLFYDSTLKDGALPFWMPDPTTDGTILLDDAFQPILDETDTPILIDARWLVLFGEELPSDVQKGGQYVISFSVAVLP